MFDFRHDTAFKNCSLTPSKAGLVSFPQCARETDSFRVLTAPVLDWVCPVKMARLVRVFGRRFWRSTTFEARPIELGHIELAAKRYFLHSKSAGL